MPTWDGPIYVYQNPDGTVVRMCGETSVAFSGATPQEGKRLVCIEPAAVITQKQSPPPLTPREQAVLDLIPFAPESILLPELLTELAKQGRVLDESSLTSDIIPRLKQGYCVVNRRRRGYSRMPS